MNHIVRKALVFCIIVILCGVYMGCSEPSKKSSTDKTSQHSHGGRGH